MSKRWQDNLPEGAPKPEPRETRRHYAMRMMRLIDQMSLDRLAQSLNAKRAERGADYD